jgi:NADPH-dependent 2,4-dienoyl-CoA reductase/sulfur reductase-like enzyme/rhodanese-related sulfurtransferase
MNNKKVLIIGGVAAGASVAARLRRLEENTRIIIFERGDHISYASCGLPYYIGRVIQKKEELLLNTVLSMKSRFNIEVRVRNEVKRIRPREKKIEAYDASAGTSYEEDYEFLVLCPGANPVNPGIPGSERPNVFTLRTIPDADIIRHYIKKHRPASAAIVGAGFIGLEMVEMLHKSGLRTHVIEATSQVMQAFDPEMAAFIHQHIKQNQIDLLLNERVTSFQGADRAENIILESGKEITVDMVVLGIGVKPETWLAEEAGLAIAPGGGIAVDGQLRTSDPSIYAAGDAVRVRDIVTGRETLLPMAGPANRQGWIIANNIAGRSLTYGGVQSTAIVGVMGLTSACTGQNERVLKKLGVSCLSCHIHPFSHATYYPGASQMCIKLIFTPDKGRLLGAQIVGQDGVDKRIDVMATALRAGMSVFDLQELELAYAPPFSSAKDPVNMAGYAAANIVKNNIAVIHWNEVADAVSRGAFLLDVRTPAETSTGMVPGAYSIPVDEVRARLAEIPKDRNVLVYCQAGVRSYLTARILRQNGSNVKNISGGFRLYTAMHS